MTKVRCSKCGQVVIDTESRLCKLRKTWDVELNYDLSRSSTCSKIVTVDCLICEICGKKYDYSKFVKRVKTRIKNKKARDAILRLIDSSFEDDFNLSKRAKQSKHSKIKQNEDNEIKQNENNEVKRNE